MNTNSRKINSRIMVSICCITYNHENYISQAIESFLGQKTNFEFEILIHDDASTDKTAEKIKYYAEKYPNIVKPILQTENQYSKGLSISSIDPKYNYSRAKGKYIALCEGDDFWISEHKLQQQVDYMESNDDCTLCFHNAIIVNEGGIIVKDSFLPKNDFYSPYFNDTDSIYTTDQMILLDFIPTNSLFFRSSYLAEYGEFIDNKKYVCGDLPTRLFFSSKGYTYYFKEKMSAYRRGVPGSASQRANSTYESKLKTIQGHIDILNDFNIYTNAKYYESIEEAINLKLFSFFYQYGSLLVCKEQQYRHFLKRASFKIRVGFFLRAHFPRIYTIISVIRRK